MKKRTNTGKRGLPALLLRFVLAVLLPAACCAPLLPAQDFDALLDDFLSGYWKAHPAGAATPAGLHSYDSLLEDLSPLALRAESERLRAFQRRLEALDSRPLPLPQQVDRAIVLDRIHLALLDLDELQSWKRNPQDYLNLLRTALQALAQREFAPADRRFQAAAARLKLFPRLLLRARSNLEKPPQLYARKAMALLPDLVDFVEKETPRAAAEQGAGKKTRKQLAREAPRAAAALRDFGKWLESELLARSTGAFILGAGAYGRRLRYLLGTEMNAEQLLAAAERDLRATREEMRAVAAGLAPQLTVAQVLGELSGQHPPEDRLAAAFRGALAEARDFVKEKRLAPLPAAGRLRILPASPPAPHAAAFLDAPGPFEPDLPYSFYFPAVRHASEEAALQILRENSHYSIPLAVVHETYPGHYVQFDRMNRAPRPARKLFASPAFIHGWALYCERMMFEEGFRTEPRARLFRLRNAARAEAAVIVDVRLHTGRLSAGDATRFLMEEGFVEKSGAETLVEQAALNPGQLCAAYAGMVEIIALRDALKQKLGPAFSLREFHESLLGLGAPPLPLARLLLLSSR